jgi:hypothetical protein
MKNIRIYLAAAVLGVALFFTACDVDIAFIDPTDSFKEDLVSETEYGIYTGGETSLQSTLTFNKKSHQLYFSDKGRISRILSNDATKYVEVELSSNPMPNGITGGSVTVQGLSAGISTQDNMTVEVLKMESDKCWLWFAANEGDAEFGAIVMWK